jgi:hypothetical protein
MHDGLLMPIGLIPMVQEVLRSRKDKGGSQTMLNQIVVDLTTGKVDGCFSGDGGFSVLRNDGTRLDYDCAVSTNFKGDSKILLSTLRGLIGEPANLEDVGAGNLVLDNGEVLLLHSDGVTKNMLTRIEEINKNRGDFKTEIPKLIEGLEDSQEKDDDRSLVVFRMP